MTDTQGTTPAAQKPAEQNPAFVAYMQTSTDNGQKEVNKIKLQANQATTKADQSQDACIAKSRKARTSATMRLQVANAATNPTTSPTLEALKSVAKQLGLNAAQAKKIEKLSSNPAHFAQELQALLGSGSLDSLPDLTTSDKALLGKVLNALENGSAEDILKSVGVSKEQVDAITKLISGNDPAKQPKSYLDAISAADAALSEVISTVCKNSADLTQLHMESQTVQSTNLTKQLSYFKEQCDHIVHEIKKAHTLSIVKKVFGYLIAAILAIVAVALQRPSLLIVAIVVITATASPKLISNLLNNLVRGMGLKGDAAEAVTVILKAVIAVALAIASGGAGAVGDISALGAVAMAGASAGMFSMEGGIENIAYLQADAENGGDVRKTDPDNAEVKKYEALGEKITMGVSIACGAISVVGSIPQIMEAATNMLTKVKAFMNIGEAAEGASTTAATGVADASETASTSSESASNAGKSALKTAFQKTVQFLKENGQQIQGVSQTGNNGIQSLASILLGITMIELAGFQRNVGEATANLHQSEATITQEASTYKKDETSKEATTTQAIDQLFTETNTEQRAFEGQIVGNVSGL